MRLIFRQNSFEYELISQALFANGGIIDCLEEDKDEKLCTLFLHQWKTEVRSLIDCNHNQVADLFKLELKIFEELQDRKIVQEMEIVRNRWKNLCFYVSSPVNFSLDTLWNFNIFSSPIAEELMNRLWTLDAVCLEKICQILTITNNERMLLNLLNGIQTMKSSDLILDDSSIISCTSSFEIWFVQIIGKHLYKNSENPLVANHAMRTLFLFNKFHQIRSVFFSLLLILNLQFLGCNTLLI